jgi:cytochrome oxidase Cu insertion factor (SCO1/SenC/PrrC family)
MGQSIAHTSTILLFDRSGKFAGTVSKDESDSSAVATLRQLIGA